MERFVHLRTAPPVQWPVMKGSAMPAQRSVLLMCGTGIVCPTPGRRRKVLSPGVCGPFICTGLAERAGSMHRCRRCGGCTSPGAHGPFDNH